MRLPYPVLSHLQKLGIQAVMTGVAHQLIQRWWWFTLFDVACFLQVSVFCDLIILVIYSLNVNEVPVC